MNNPAKYLNGFTTAQPYEAHEIDQHPDAQRIWATIAKHYQPAFEDGANDKEEELAESREDEDETMRREVLDDVRKIMDVLNICVIAHDWDGDDITGETVYDSDEYDGFLWMLRDRGV